MTATLADELRTAAASAVFSFPLTPFGPDGELDRDALERHLRHQVSWSPAALFPACGAGEFSALDEDEYRTVVATAVDAAEGRRVIAGAGYGWRQALRFASIAADAGADALLLMPHYLVEAPQAGLVAQISEFARRSPLPFIVYQRGATKLTLESVRTLAELPQVIGFKDGYGDLDLLTRLRTSGPEHWVYFNGTPTAEIQASAYGSIGIDAYSSAVHCFMPELAQAFHSAFAQDRRDDMGRYLREFYVPLCELRDLVPGYAVALLKAAARLRGNELGEVRAPLVPVLPEHLDRLSAIVDTGLQLVGASRRPGAPASASG